MEESISPSLSCIVKMFSGSRRIFVIIPIPVELFRGMQSIVAAVTPREWKRATSLLFLPWADRGCAAVPGFSSEIERPARFGDRKSGKSTARHAQHVTIRSAPRSRPIKHTHRKYRFLSGSICPMTLLHPVTPHFALSISSAIRFATF